MQERELIEMDPETDLQILVIENNDEVRADLSEELEGLGHQPVATWSGIEGLRLLKSRRFSIVLVDDYLPDMYIGEFLETASHLPIRPKIWVMKASDAKEAGDTCNFESGSFPVVSKKDILRIFRSPESDGDDDASR